METTDGADVALVRGVLFPPFPPFPPQPPLQGTVTVVVVWTTDGDEVVVVCVLPLLV